MDTPEAPGFADLFGSVRDPKTLAVCQSCDKTTNAATAVATWFKSPQNPLEQEWPCARMMIELNSIAPTGYKRLVQKRPRLPGGPEAAAGCRVSDIRIVEGAE